MKLIITDAPAFYKINLYNEIAKQRDIFVLFVGTIRRWRNKDFSKGEMHFKHCFIKGNLLWRAFRVFLILRRMHYDEVIINGWHLLPMWAAVFFSKRRKNAMVVESSIKDSTTTGCKSRLKRLILSRVSKVYASGKLQAELVRALGFKQQIVITKGVGIFQYVKQPPYVPKTAVTDFIFVGRLVPVKNLEFLIRMFNKHPELHLNIIGYGESEASLRAMAAPNIRFSGAIDNARLSQYYQQADVFVLPSLKETWGLVVEEALNNGLPVLVSDRVGCVGEVVTPDNGLVFSLDEQDFERKLAQMRDVDYYNRLRLNISKSDFAAIERRQAECYI